ncbi:heparinase II/III family protein [Rathayibacter sp. VKM Ac-2856]|uniref:heparinase II/III domain-containing protein n=1 Tax=unclassified Rathayibacter TaxID=2609250 RepID=UPI001563A439|nr:MULTISPECIES: heparinase II/III family protein [unclassified Rathayibacter]NQX06023.1 heparinase II/III family protein [Rathayibacter sp. VKM Ac-2858]NQX21027.1 heparinase II/III family protein [Rathayibacter sp. VKM Ac-2856]
MPQHPDPASSPGVIESFRGPLAAAFSPSGPLSARGVLVAPERSLPVPTAADRDAWAAADAPTLAAVAARAEADLLVPWPQPLASEAVRVHRDGNRDRWEQSAFERQRRLSRAVLLAASAAGTGADGDLWLDRVADGVQLLCEQSSWCWPAHDDALRRHGSVLADVADPFLDLGAGEVAGQLAWLDHVLGERLDDRYPGLRRRIRLETRRRVLDPFLARDDWHWLGLDGDVHNWNPWITGNVLVAALRLLDGPGEEDERAAVVTRAVAALDRYVAVLPDDGAIDEGYAYWWNGACRALEALDVLAHATGGAWDASAVPALRATVAFPHRSHLGGDWYVAHADGQALQSRDQPWHAVHRAGRRVGDAAAMAHAAAQRSPGEPAASEKEGLGRLLHGATDPLWVSAVQPGAVQPGAPAALPPLPRDVWLESVQVLLARTTEGSAEGLTLVAKGGHNAEHHNHNDVGSFQVASDGVPVVVDAGRPTYTAATFGPERYSIWTMRSEWHNLPVVRGLGQPPGREAAAADVSVTLDDASASFSAELAAAYPGTGLRSWRRTVSLDRPSLDRPSARVVLEDRWDLAPWDDHDDEPGTSIRLLLAGDVVTERGAARVRPLGAARPLRIAWDPACEHRIVVRSLEDPMLTSVWGERLTLLEIDATARRELRIAIDLDPPIGDQR